jgi:hypothetical protein
MSERLEARSEVLKLARLLSVDERELEFLRELPSGELREFREQVTNRMFDSSSKLLGRIGAAARLIPSGLIATVAQRAFGPLLCARAAGAVDPDKAIDVVRRLPTGFLCDAAVEVDPRRVAAIIAAVPADVVVPVAAEMGARGEHVTMGRFLAFVPDHAIAAAIGVLDDEAVLRTAFVLEHKERLDHAIGLLPEERLPGILRRATELGLWPEALDLLDHLSNARRGRVADIVAEQDEAVIGGIIEAVAESGLWDSLLPIIALMGDQARVRLAAVRAFHEPAVMGDILRAAAAQGLWVDLVPLIGALPDSARRLLPEIASRLELDLIERVLCGAAQAPDTLPTLIDLVRDMDAAGQAKLIAAIDAADRQLGADLVGALTNPAQAASWLKRLPTAVQAAIQRAAVRFDMQATLEHALAETERV